MPSITRLRRGIGRVFPPPAARTPPYSLVPASPPVTAGLVIDLDAARAAYADSARTTPAADGAPSGGSTDQSGYGNHAVQATAGNRPDWFALGYAERPNWKCGSHAGVAADTWLAVPSQAWDGHNYTLLLFQQPILSTANPAVSALWVEFDADPGHSQYLAIDGYGSNCNPCWDVHSDNANALFMLPVYSRFAPVLVISRPDGAVVRTPYGRVAKGPLSTGTYSSTSNFGGFTGSAMFNYLGRALRFNRGISGSEENLLWQWALDQTGHGVSYPKKLVVVGDSISEAIDGNVTGQSKGWADITAATLGDVELVLDAVAGGDTLSLLNQYAIRQAGLFDTTKARCSYVFAGWANSIGGNSVAQMYAWAVSAMQNARATGYQRYGVTTCLPRGTDPTLIAKIASFNAMLRANLPADVPGAFVADLTGIAGLQDPTNLTYFAADNLHLTNAGQALIAPAVLPLVA